LAFGSPAAQQQDFLTGDLISSQNKTYLIFT